MEIIQLLKLLSCENKLIIISHFYKCKCGNNCVTNILDKLKISQSNLSTHITDLFKKGILTVTQVHKKRYYKMDLNFINQFDFLLKPLISNTKFKEYSCICNH